MEIPESALCLSAGSARSERAARLAGGEDETLKSLRGTCAAECQCRASSETARDEEEMDDSEAFALACRDGVGARELGSLLANPRVDPRYLDSACLRWAVVKVRLDVVSALLEDGRADPTANEHQSLCWACQKGECELAALLLRDPRVRADCLGGWPFVLACQSGSAPLVSLLLKLSVRDGDSEAERGVDAVTLEVCLSKAAAAGNVEVVCLLLEHLSSRAQQCLRARQTFALACAGGQHELATTLVVKFLPQFACEWCVSEAMLVACQGNACAAVHELVRQASALQEREPEAACAGAALSRALTWACAAPKREALVEQLVRKPVVRHGLDPRGAGVAPAARAFERLVERSMDAARVCVGLYRSRASPFRRLPLELTAAILAMVYSDELVVSETGNKDSARRFLEGSLLSDVE